MLDDAFMKSWRKLKELPKPVEDYVTTVQRARGVFDPVNRNHYAEDARELWDNLSEPARGLAMNYIRQFDREWLP